MSILTGPEIARQVRAGAIVIDPFDPARTGPNSHNLRLADELLVYTEFRPLDASDPSHLSQIQRMLRNPEWLKEYQPVLDLRRKNPTQRLTIPPEGLVLVPGVLYLGRTIEYTETHGFVPILEGRSSAARLGLQVHATAGFGDHGFKGTWTLELSVVQPLRVYAGAAICQLSYTTLWGDPRPYVGKYQGQSEPRASELWREHTDRAAPEAVAE